MSSLDVNAPCFQMKSLELGEKKLDFDALSPQIESPELTERKENLNIVFIGHVGKLYVIHFVLLT